MEAPILLAPALKRHIWGGTRLWELFGKGDGTGTIAESWELSAHPEGESLVASGPDRGLSLSAYIQKHGREILGSRGGASAVFPLLVKLIDARDSLSVQVHPDDAYAMAHEGEQGKTEFWYILDAKPGAALYYGFRRPVTREEFQRHIQENTLPEILRSVVVAPGDAVFIPAGTLHAIGSGIVLCEIQQSSNVTYRVYDYDRRDAQGNPRPLHIPQALEVTRLTPAPALTDRPAPEQRTGYTRRLLASCPYFTAAAVTVDSRAELPARAESFQSFTLVQGTGVLTGGGAALRLSAGDTAFVPAGLPVSVTGACTLVQAYL